MRMTWVARELASAGSQNVRAYPMSSTVTWQARMTGTTVRVTVMYPENRSCAATMPDTIPGRAITSQTRTSDMSSADRGTGRVL